MISMSQIQEKIGNVPGVPVGGCILVGDVLHAGKKPFYIPGGCMVLYAQLTNRHQTYFKLTSFVLPSPKANFWCQREAASFPKRYLEAFATAFTES